MKNARRRRNRLTKRARLLTTEDLLTVVALREGECAADFVSSAAACANAEAGQVSAEGGADEAEMPRAGSEAAEELRDASSHEPEPIADSERG